MYDGSWFRTIGMKCNRRFNDIVVEVETWRGVRKNCLCRV